LSLGSEAPTTATVTIADWTLLERLRRAVMPAALCWCVAGLLLPIPLVHLVAPPLLLLAGPVVFLLRFFARSSFKEVVGVCPRCKGEARTMPFSGDVSPTTSVMCDGCGNQLTLQVSVPG
jgi:hypothetical protein